MSTIMSVQQFEALLIFGNIWVTYSKVWRLWIRLYTLVNTNHVNLLKASWEALLHIPITDVTQRKRTPIIYIFMMTKTILRS